MYCISDQQIDFVLSDLSRQGIKIESLRYSLLDHICILIEQNLKEGEDFEAFYTTTIKTFYKQELREIEEEIHFRETCRNRLVLSRPLFFVLLFTIFIGPFIGCDILWLACSAESNGWNLPFRIWGFTLVFSIFPMLVLLVLLLTPEWLDPVIPRRSKILLGISPFVKIVPYRNS
jgi:hypothetical protein